MVIQDLRFDIQVSQVQGINLPPGGGCVLLHAIAARKTRNLRQRQEVNIFPVLQLCVPI